MIHSPRATPYPRQDHEGGRGVRTEVGPLIFAAVLAQATVGATADAAQLERIRKAIADAPAIVVAAPRRDGLVFRVTVHARPVEKPMWDDWSHVPSYIRPKMGLYQFEYLQQVTPEA